MNAILNARGPVDIGSLSAVRAINDIAAAVVAMIPDGERLHVMDNGEYIPAADVIADSITAAVFRWNELWVCHRQGYTFRRWFVEVYRPERINRANCRYF